MPMKPTPELLALIERTPNVTIGGACGGMAGRDQSADPGKMILRLPVHPPSLNKLMRGKIRDRIRLGKAFRSVVAANWKGPKATGKRAVTIRIVLGKGDRACDPDAYFKACGDSLKKCGAIKDDNRHGVVWMPVEYEKGKSTATVIILEDVA